MNVPMATAPVVGRDAGGDWTVRDGAGRLLGRFASSIAAYRFADRERRARPSSTTICPPDARPRLHGRLTLRTGGRSGRRDQGDA